MISSGGLTLENTPVKKVILYCHSTFEAENQFVDKKITGILGKYNKIIQDNLRKSFENMRSALR